jgi:hypothetical protein
MPQPINVHFSYIYRFQSITSCEYLMAVSLLIFHFIKANTKKHPLYSIIQLFPVTFNQRLNGSFILKMKHQEILIQTAFNLN